MLMLRLLALLLPLLCLPLPVAAWQAQPAWSGSGAARPDGSHSGPGRARPGAARPAAINVNTADAATLVALKGVGEKKARAIVAFRKAHGPFATLDDFEEVPGIGPALIEANRDRIRFR